MGSSSRDSSMELERSGIKNIRLRGPTKEEREYQEHYKDSRSLLLVIFNMISIMEKESSPSNKEMSTRES